MTCLWKKPFERQNIFPCGPKLRQKNKELFQRLKTWWRIDPDFLTTKITILLAPTCLAPGSCKYTSQARLSRSNFLPQMLFELVKGEQREPKFIYRETEAIEIEVICPMPPNNTEVKVRVEQAETERSCDTWTSANIRTSCLLFPSFSFSFLFPLCLPFYVSWPMTGAHHELWHVHQEAWVGPVDKGPTACINKLVQAVVIPMNNKI